MLTQLKCPQHGVTVGDDAAREVGQELPQLAVRLIPLAGHDPRAGLDLLLVAHAVGTKEFARVGIIEALVSNAVNINVQRSRSEERRVGKECRGRWARAQCERYRNTTSWSA